MADDVVPLGARLAERHLERRKVPVDVTEHDEFHDEAGTIAEWRRAFKNGGRASAAGRTHNLPHGGAELVAFVGQPVDSPTVGAYKPAHHQAMGEGWNCRNGGGGRLSRSRVM